MTITMKMTATQPYDLVVVGSGIVGLATALAARQQGLSTAVVERQAHCIGASIRNFGFVTVSGQRAGAHWQRARRSRDVWVEIAPQAGIPVIHEGLYLPTQRPEAAAVAEAFRQTEMGAGCRWLSESEITQRLPFIGDTQGVLYSPHELRVESKTAIAQLADWLAREQGVDFYWQTAVNAINLPTITTSRGEIHAERCVVCPGNDFTSLYPEVIAQARAQQCTLQMLRVMPEAPISLPGALMSDQSLARYDGFADLPAGQALIALLDQTQPAHRQAGVHLIVVQSADGSLIVGDSHVYSDAERPFRDDDIDALILSELQTLIPSNAFTVTERWLGVYPSAEDVVFSASPEPHVVLGIVTSGTGASTGFAFGEELVAQVCAS